MLVALLSTCSQVARGRGGCRAVCLSARKVAEDITIAAPRASQPHSLPPSPGCCAGPALTGGG